MTAAPPGDGVEPTKAAADEALDGWLREVELRVAAAEPPRGLRRQVTLPVRAARRFWTLVGDVGFSEAVLVATEYAGRRLGRRA